MAPNSSDMMCFIKVQTKPRERNIVVLSHSLNKHGFMCDTMCNIYDFPICKLRNFFAMRIAVDC